MPTYNILNPRDRIIMDFDFNESLYFLQLIDALPVGMTLAGVMLLTFELVQSKRKKQAFNKLYVALMAAYIVIGVVAVAWSSSVVAAGEGGLRAQRTAQIEELYGVELTNDEYEALYTPREEPSKAFAAYGETSVADLDGKTVVLTWSNGEFLLYDTTSGLPLE